METDTKVIRPAAWFFAIVGLGELVSTGAAVVLFVQNGLDWWTMTAVAVAVMFNLGLIDLVVSRIELTPDTLRVVELFRSRSVAKRDIVTAKRDGGSLFLQLQDGRWFAVPDTGKNTLGTLNTIRAWLKR